MSETEVLLKCEKCDAAKGEVKTETVTGVGYGWKCEVCRWWNWIFRSIPEEETTICSTMHCYNRAKETNDPLHPPFCEQCQDRKAGKTR